MKHIKLFESFDESSNVKKITSLELSDWIERHEFSDFNKTDTLIVFKIFDNIDQRIFGVWDKKFPFGKSREIWFHITNRKPNDPNLKKIDWFEGNDLEYISKMSSYYFESNKFCSITLERNYNDIRINKYQDEWYTIHCYSEQHGELCYLCDSLEGLEEMFIILEDLYSKEWT